MSSDSSIPSLHLSQASQKALKCEGGERCNGITKQQHSSLCLSLLTSSIQTPVLFSMLVAVLLKMLLNFGTELGPDLKSMFDTITEGEVVVTAGLENSDLRVQLEGLLKSAGLVPAKTDDDENGFGLPPLDTNTTTILTSLKRTCFDPDPQSSLNSLRSSSPFASKAPARGPALPLSTNSEPINNEDSSDDEAPNREGEGKRSALTPAQVKAQAALREWEMQVRCTF